MPKKLDHLHTFVRDHAKKPGPKIFKCIDPDCWFFARGERIVGKRARCKSCGGEFILTRFDLQRKYPHCDNCMTGKKQKQEQAETSLLEKALEKMMKGEA